MGAYLMSPPLPAQYDCVVGTAHVGQVCVPLCPNSEGAPPCIPCEDVRANCAWVGPRGLSPSAHIPCALWMAADMLHMLSFKMLGIHAACHTVYGLQAFPSFRSSSFITHYLESNTGACF